MTSARAIEYRITRNLVEGNSPPATLTGAERTIAISAGVVCLLALGSLAPALVFAAIMGSALTVLSQ